jgi:arabinogalactan oligomer/maltooligosaccharide transport system permease protein
MYSRWLPYAFIAPAMLALAVLVFYPLTYGVYLSFTDARANNVVRRIGVNEIPASYENVGLENYETIINPDHPNHSVYKFYQTLQQTLFWTVTNVILHIGLGLGLALLLNRPIKGQGIYRALLIVPWAVPTYVSAFAWRFLYNQQYGAFNAALGELGFGAVPWLSDAQWAMFSVIVANTWLAIPFNMVTFLGGLQSIPPDLYEAADVDGSTWTQKFLYITVPMLRPVMITATLLGFIWTFNAFNIIYLVSEGGPSQKTEILATWAWRLGFDRDLYGLAAAYSFIILLILLAFSSVYIIINNRSKQGGIL